MLNMQRVAVNWKKIRAADKITIIYQFLASLVVILYHTQIRYDLRWLLLHAAIVIWLWLAPSYKKGLFNKHFVYWSPIFLILILFSELHYLIHPIRRVDLDNLLILIDKNLFSVHPTIWLERITHPVLTEYLQLIYTSFYFLPILLIIILLKQKKEREADFFIFSVMIGFYISYIGYFSVPAIGPRFTLDHLQSFQLQGLWLTLPLRELLNTLENIQRDCFPSGHTAITLITMHYACKYHKIYYYILILIGTSLIFSTVYLRYHYVVDVIAGSFLAFLVILCGKFFYKYLSHWQEG